VNGFAARARHALDRRFGGVLSRLDEALVRLDRIEGELAALRARVDGELSPALRAVATEEAATRRRLAALRASPGYAAAFEDPEPLVSIVVPTRERPRLLVERALASALGQTHERLEVVVAGDAVGDEVERAVAAVGDPRVRFASTTHRVVDPRPDRHWLAAATLPRMLGYELARGAWIADLDDDDALRPDAVERLLAHARERRAEVVHGVLEEHWPDGSSRPLGGFPPQDGRFGWQGAIWHAGLRFIGRDLLAATYDRPADLFRLDRMLRAGVRIAHLERITCDYFPSALHGQHDVADPVDVGEREPGVQRQGEQ
jgi:hypothetical protein